MAVTQNSYTGNGSTTNYAFTFPYLKSSEVKAQIDATVTTAFTLANATTVQFNTAPSSGAKIKIFRETDTDNLAATFYAGSAIKSEDLNDNFTQNLHTTQEVNARYLSNLGGTMVGDMTMAENVDIIFEGATDDAYETTLTVTDPTADRTITLPNVTGTVITTGDTGTVATGMIAADAVTNAKIADNSIDSEHYVDGSIDTVHLADNSVTGAKLAAGTIGTTDIADSGITTAKIADANITTAKIAGDAINGTKIADDSINSEHYVDGSIDTAHIADSQVTTAKIAADAVTGAKIADDQINSEHYVDGSIDTAHIADAQVTHVKLANDCIDGDNIQNDVINSEHYAAGSIDTEHIADSQITTAKIADANVTTAKIADANVTTAKVADGAITQVKIASNSIGSGQIGANAVGASELADDAVDTAAIADSAVTTAKLATGATITNATNAAHVSVADNENTNENNLVPFIEDASATGNVGLESDGDFHYNPSTGAVTATKFIGDGSELTGLDTASISDGSVSTVKLAANAVTGAKIAADAVTGAKIADNAVDSEHYTDGSIDTAHIADLQITSIKIDGDAITGDKIADDAVDSEHLAADSIDAEHYAAGSVDTTALGADAVTGAKIADDAINSEHYTDGSIDTAHIADAQVTTAKLASDAVTTVKITDLNVTTAKIAADAITGAKIADDAVGSEHIEVLDAALQFGDSVKAQFGASNDLEIFHNGSNSYISNDTGLLYLRGADQYVSNADGTENMARFEANGAVQLYYDNSLKFETNTNGCLLGDDIKLQFGGGADLEIFHDGSNSWIKDVGTGVLAIAGSTTQIKDSTGGEACAKFMSNGAVELYYDNSKKFETNTNGCLLGDSVKLQIGGGADLQIYHTSDQNYIDGRLGNIYIRSEDSVIIEKQDSDGTNQENMARFLQDGAVELYYDNSKKLETYSGGVTVTGDFAISGELNLLGDSDAAKYLDARVGTNAFHIRKVTGGDAGHENMAYFQGDAGCVLYYDNSVKFETNANGCIVGDNGKVQFGGNADLEIYHDGTGSYIDNKTGHLFIRGNVDADVGANIYLQPKAGENGIIIQDDGPVYLYDDHSIKLTTTSTGVYVYGGIRLGANNAANEMDDYEEGTFTATARDATSGGNATTTNANCHYTKVGRLVTVQVRIENINTTGMTSGNQFYITGLPFTSIDATGNRSTASCYVVDINPSSSSDIKEHLNAIVAQNTSYAYFAWSRTEGESASTFKVADIEDDAGDIEFTMTYTAT